MNYDSETARKDYTVIPMTHMINAGSVIFFGEDPGFTESWEEDDDRTEAALSE